MLSLVKHIVTRNMLFSKSKNRKPATVLTTVISNVLVLEPTGKTEHSKITVLKSLSIKLTLVSLNGLFD